MGTGYLDKIFITVFLWHNVKEEVLLNEIELELQMKKAEMISRRIGHVPVATVKKKLHAKCD